MMEPKKLYRLAIAKWGRELQMVMVTEEMSELTREISKKLRGKGDDIAMAQEIADVEIMLEQLKEMWSLHDRVGQFKNYQLKKLEEILTKK